MRNARLDEAQAGIKIAGRNINNLRYADDTTLMAESEELKSLLKVKEESEKSGLKLNIQKINVKGRMKQMWENNENCKITTTTENSQRGGNIRPPFLSPEKPVCQELTVRTGHGTTD